MSLIGDIIGVFTGSSGADAAEASADAQIQAQREAIEASTAASGRAQQFLAPFGSNASRIQELQLELDGLRSAGSSTQNTGLTSGVSSGALFDGGLVVDQNILNALGISLPSNIGTSSANRIAEIEAEIAGLSNSPTDLGLNNASFLIDPQQQYDFLQNNPLYELALENANRNTLQGSAASGRLSSGDTLQNLSNNVLLSAAPLIGQQSQAISGLLDFGNNVATTQANIEIGQGTNVANSLSNIGDAQAAGIIGAQNAQTAGTQNLLNLGGALLGGF